MKFITSAVVGLLFIAMASPAFADKPIASVAGTGMATITDPDENTYAGNVFAIAGQINDGGTATGKIEFLFASAFSDPWGAVPGVDFISLNGTITGGAVADDGSVLITGLLTEKDFSWGDGVVYVERDVPFAIVVAPGSRQFSLQWCLLPLFGIEVTQGSLRVE